MGSDGFHDNREALAEVLMNGPGHPKRPTQCNDHRAALAEILMNGPAQPQQPTQYNRLLASLLVKAN